MVVEGQNEQILEFRSRKRDRSLPLVSVVAPVFNEESCLEELHARLTHVLQQINDRYEILFIDDGSTDRSLEIIGRLYAKDPNVGYCSFSRNFGHESATSCGLAKATGQTVVLIDADLQDPPEQILPMLQAWRDGYDMVYAQRRSRDGETAFTKISSHAFYRLFSHLARVNMPVDTGDFRLMDRAVVDAFLQLPERNRFVRGMISWTGFRQIALKYDRVKRHAGVTKYNFFRRLNLAFDAICGMTNAPLRWIGVFGVALSTSAAAAGALLGGLHLLTPWQVSSTAFLAAGVFCLSGVQLTALGVLGEYIGRIFVEVQARPHYLIAREGSPRHRQEKSIDRAAG